MPIKDSDKQREASRRWYLYNKEHKAAYDKQRNEAKKKAKAEAKAKEETCSNEAKEAEKRAKKKERDKRYRENNRETIRKNWRKSHDAHREEHNAKKRQFIAEHSDEINEKRRELYKKKRSKKFAAALLEIDPTNTQAMLALIADSLKECERLKVKALRLPCGQREECFGPPKCPNCPKNAVIPDRRHLLTW